MKRSTITLAAGLILAAAALKLAFPLAGTRTAATIPSESEPAAAVHNQQTESSKAVTTVTINAADFIGGESDTVETSALPAAVEEAVEIFLTQQEPYGELALPANVSYEVELPDFSFVCPVTARVSSTFGYRVHPLENLTKFHYGTDLAAQSGDDIVSFAAGTVSQVGEDPVNGKYIKIDHPDGYATTYAHCGTVYVAQGQKVAAGEKIALVGATGKVTGPHLHFELTRNGVYLNPEFYLAAL